MSQILIENKFAEIREIKSDEKETGALRVWCNLFPKYYNIQIRSRNPLGGKNADGKDRTLIATAGVEIEEIARILRSMNRSAYGLSSEFDHVESSKPDVRVSVDVNLDGTNIITGTIKEIVNRDNGDHFIVSLDEPTSAGNGLHITEIVVHSENVTKI